MQRDNDWPIGRFDKDSTHNIFFTSQCHLAQVESESLMFDLQKMSS